MKIVTEASNIGFISDHHLSGVFQVIGYNDGSSSCIPPNFFRDWTDQRPGNGTFYIGKNSGCGVGSLVKYDGDAQSLKIGRFVSGGLRLRFLLNGQHETRTISTFMFFLVGGKNAPPPQYGDSIIKNDVWLGDEMMMLGGGIIENGCVIGARSLLPPNFRCHPYGIYAGVPAKLIRFRFSERIRELLLESAWWNMPLDWIRKNGDLFVVDLTVDEGKSLEILTEMKQRKLGLTEEKWM